VSWILFLVFISSIFLAATFLIPTYPPYRRTPSKRRKTVRNDLIASEFEKVRKRR